MVEASHNSIVIDTLKIVFVVPYRDRIEHKTFFDYYMNFIMEDYNDDEYIILYVHQKDERPFNRGAMKNIGFLYMKNKFPLKYNDLTYVFHDVDSLPYTKNLLDYETQEGTIKHFYGYTFALGGIVSVYGKDFEAMNGFPNYWAWGFEDNILQRRANHKKIEINRSTFFEIKSKKILHFIDDLRKYISFQQYNKMSQSNFQDVDGLNKIKNLATTFTTESSGKNTYMVNVHHFQSHYKHNAESNFITHNVFDGPKVKSRPRPRIGMNLFSRNPFS